MQHWELGDDSASYRQLVARFVSMMTRSGLTARVHVLFSACRVHDVASNTFPIGVMTKEWCAGCIHGNPVRNLEGRSELH